MVIVMEARANGETIGALVANPKKFNTGSTGFFGTGKMVINGKKYQCQVQLVEVGSKDKPEDDSSSDPT